MKKNIFIIYFIFLIIIIMALSCGKSGNKDIDPLPPSGKVIINKNEDFTDSTSVVLFINAHDNIDKVMNLQMNISNDNVLNSSAWEQLNDTKKWNLSQDDGQKSVYVWFKDKQGNINKELFVDTIILDTVKPEVVSVNPAYNTTDVSVYIESISAIFSEQLNKSSILLNLKLGTKSIDGKQSYDSSNKTIIFVPTSKLDYSSKYTVSIPTKVTDLAGNPLSKITSWNFKTVSNKTPPEIVSTIPVNNTSNIAVNTPITVSFNEPMDTSSINTSTYMLNSDSSKVVGEISIVNNNKTAAFIPVKRLKPNTRYKVTLYNGIKDTENYNIVSDYSWVFTTGDSIIYPEVEKHSSSTNVPLTGVISLTFNNEIDSKSINTNTFIVKNSNNVNLKGTVVYESKLKTAYFYYSEAFSALSTYTVSVSKNIKDIYGYTMEMDYSWSFATEANTLTSPEKPQEVKAVAGENKVNINWEVIPGATSYNIYWSDTENIDMSNIHISYNNLYMHTELVNSIKYYYIITAVNSYGESLESIKVSATPFGILRAPTKLFVNQADKELLVTWDAVTGATSYNVYWLTEANITKKTGIKKIVNNIYFNHTNLDNNIKYYYIVTAVNEYGESIASEIVNCKPGLPPSAPTNFEAIAGNKKIFLIWDEVTLAYSYNIYYSTKPGVTKNTGIKISKNQSYEYTEDYIEYYTHSSINNDITYYYVITAVNYYGGESVESREISSTPNPPILSVYPRYLEFGSTDIYQYLTISNVGIGELTWSGEDDQTWFSYSNNYSGSTTSSSDVKINVNRDGLSRGNYTGSIFIDSDGGKITIPVSIRVPNNPPDFTTTPLAFVDTTNTYIYDVNATDIDGDSITYSLVSPPNGMTINNSTGIITWNPKTIGTYNITVSVEDIYGSNTMQTFALYVNENIQLISNIITTGSFHSMALKKDKSIVSWGYNVYGQLGDGTTSNKNTPVKVLNISEIIVMSAGYRHSLALSNDGTVWAWGNNEYGQLGDGTNTTILYKAAQVLDLSGVISISGGYYHSIALKSNGTVWTWGNNESGQLGDGTYIERKAPVQVLDLSEIIAISAGNYHNLALKNDGTVWSWGSNVYGQLGDGTIVSKNFPVQVLDLSGVTSISGSYYYNLALKNDGTVRAWGYNLYGQLGDGTTINRNKPVQVLDLSGVISISGGNYHSIALKNNGTVWTWGSNEYGQLGDGTTTDKLVPTQILELFGIAAISGGSYHNVVLKNDNSIWAWGSNSFGQIGDGTTVNKYLPVQAKVFE